MQQAVILLPAMRVKVVLTRLTAIAKISSRDQIRLERANNSSALLFTNEPQGGQHHVLLLY